ncbi:hypothetical protein PV325_014035 [Microctonus aethiopoides]|nr:hypothetical protein PV325_014035 [Microctonus aethiopoides]
MDHDTDGDGAINLSTSQRPSASTTPNGDGPVYSQEQHDKDQKIYTVRAPTLVSPPKFKLQDVRYGIGGCYSTLALSFNP